MIGQRMLIDILKHEDTVVFIKLVASVRVFEAKITIHASKIEEMNYSRLKLRFDLLIRGKVGVVTEGGELKSVRCEGMDVAQEGSAFR